MERASFELGGIRRQSYDSHAPIVTLSLSVLNAGVDGKTIRMPPISPLLMLPSMRLMPREQHSNDPLEDKSRLRQLFIADTLPTADLWMLG